MTRIRHVTLVETPAAHVLSVHFSTGRRLGDGHYAVALAHDADPYEIALRLEVLAGEIRAGMRVGG